MGKMMSKEVAKDFASVYVLYKRKQHLHLKAWHKGLCCHCTVTVCAEPRRWGELGPRHHPDRAGQAADFQSEPPSKGGFLNLYLRVSPWCHLPPPTLGVALGALPGHKRDLMTSQKPHVALLFFPFFNQPFAGNLSDLGRRRNIKLTCRTLIKKPFYAIFVLPHIHHVRTG